MGRRCEQAQGFAQKTPMRLGLVSMAFDDVFDITDSK